MIYMDVLDSLKRLRISSSITSFWIPLEVRSYISWGVLGLIGTMTLFASLRLNPQHYNVPHK